MPGSSDPGFDTLALHAGAAPDPATGARAVPIHLTHRRSCSRAASTPRRCSTWSARATSTAASRNPTNAVLEERIAALEGGVGAIATASGQAALHLAIATLAGAGSHIVALERAVRRLAQPAALHAVALRHRRRPSSSPATSTPGAPRSGPRRGCCSARRSATRGSTCSTSRPSRAIAHDARPAAAGRLDLHHAVADEAVRPRRRPASSTRRPSSCPATAPSSAACWSTAASSTGTRPCGTAASPS